MKKYLILAIGVAVLALVASACGNKKKAAAEEKRYRQMEKAELKAQKKAAKKAAFL